MRTKQFFCEICGTHTEHRIEGDEDDCGEMALCLVCGRLHSVPGDCHPSCRDDTPDDMEPSR